MDSHIDIEVMLGLLLNELASSERKKIREHLDACEACRALHAQLGVVTARMRAEAQPGAPSRVLVDLIEQQSTRGSRYGRQRWTGPWVAAAALAALLLAFVAGFQRGRAGGTQAPRTTTHETSVRVPLPVMPAQPLQMVSVADATSTSGRSLTTSVRDSL